MGKSETNNKATFSAKQAQLLKKLAEGETVAAGCRAIMIGRSQYYKWCKNPDWKKACDELSNLSFKYLSQEIGQASASAFDVIKELLCSVDENMRFKSASALLDMVMKIRAQVDIQERLEKLESAQEKK